VIARAPRKTRLFVVLGLALAGAAVNGPSRADADAASPDVARRARVAVTVGTHKVTVGELEDRMAGIPPFQLQTFGASRDEIMRTFVEQVIVRDLVLTAGAEERGLHRELPTKQLLQRALSTATLRTTRNAFPSANAIPMDDVRRYYEENRSRFDSPERINVWRILCSSREDAQAVLEAAKREPSITKWADLARERSIDKATNLRSGNLGFLGPDGTSNEAGLKADPALVKAVQSVKDGELVAQPIAEGNAFAVVWRRATVAANRRSVEESAAQIRSAIFRERTERAEKSLLDDLRAKNVKEVNEALLGQIELRPFDAGVSLPRSSALPQGPRPPAPVPGPSAVPASSPH